MSAFPDDRPPKLGLGMIKKFLLGAVGIVLLSTATAASALILEFDDTAQNFIRENVGVGEGAKNALDDVEPGKPQTLLLLGSDRRYVDKKEGNPVRSDTIMLARLDPEQNATALLNVPRDLRVQIPGRGTAKMNEAFALGGPELTLKTLRRLLGIPIHHVVIMNFGGFQRAVNRLGCVYVDVDRKYFNDNNPPRGGGPNYATIDVPAGYQKLCGQDSLDYVRYRHFDDDFVRAARQQEYLSQAKDQIGVGKIFSDRDELLKIFGRYTQTDIDSDTAILRLLKLALDASQHPTREVHFRGEIDPEDPTFVRIGDESLRKMVDEFMQVRASSGPRKTKTKRTTKARRQNRRKSGDLAPGLLRAKDEGENQALKLFPTGGLPVYYPTVKLRTGTYSSDTRKYTITDRGGRKYRSYRMVVAQGENGQYYGVQGTTWKAPPILDDPTYKTKLRGRNYEVFKDGNRIRLVAWRTPQGVYWVSNTLSQRLSNRQMLGIARSLTKLGS
jgi:polyisoprenyl-teichoic acid--peptidoglycan teichoic acid transferase